MSLTGTGEGGTSMKTLNWDFTHSASSYSALAGILAGFALTAITILVTAAFSRREIDTSSDRDRLEAMISWLTVAFFGLVIVSFLLAVLAGDDRFVTTVDPTSGQLHFGATTLLPLVMGLPASVLFSVAAMQLFLGVIWLFAYLRLGWLAQVCARIMFGFMVPLSAVYVHSTFTDYEWARTQTPPAVSLQSWQWTIGATAVPVVAFVLYRTPHYLQSLGHRLARKRGTRAALRPLRVTALEKGVSTHGFQVWVRAVAIVASLSATLIIAIAFGYWEDVPESVLASGQFHLSDLTGLVYGGLAVLWTLYALGLPVISETARKVEQPKPVSSVHATI